jgi:hypothetical protein
VDRLAFEAEIVVSLTASGQRKPKADLTDLRRNSDAMSVQKITGSKRAAESPPPYEETFKPVKLARVPSRHGAASVGAAAAAAPSSFQEDEDDAASNIYNLYDPDDKELGIEAELAAGNVRLSTAVLALQVLKQRHYTSREYAVLQTKVGDIAPAAAVSASELVSAVASDSCAVQVFTSLRALTAPAAAAASADSASDSGLVLKFARHRYGVSAHRRAEAAGLAPSLHAVITLPGEWIAVLMNRIDESNGWMRLQSRFGRVPDFINRLLNDVDAETSTLAKTGKDSATVMGEVFEDEDNAADLAEYQFFQSLLRAYDAFSSTAGEGYGESTAFVHGDLRPGNVFAKLTRSGIKSGQVEWKFMFIDFDWAGLEGIARYPMSINPHPAAGWVPGVIAGAHISRARDKQQLLGLAMPVLGSVSLSDA